MPDPTPDLSARPPAPVVPTDPTPDLSADPAPAPATSPGTPSGATGWCAR